MIRIRDDIWVRPDYVKRFERVLNPPVLGEEYTYTLRIHFSNGFYDLKNLSEEEVEQQVYGIISDIEASESDF